MDDLALARALHVFAIVLWIGGVAFVTTILLPSIRKRQNELKGPQLFESLEGPFSLQAKFTTLLAGLTGLYIIYLTDGWNRFLEPSYWWLSAMVAVWFIFTMVLFVLEPLFLHAWFRQKAGSDPQAVLLLLQRMHWVLLTLSLITVLGAVYGSHG